MDVSTLQVAVESLRTDIDMILEARVPASEAPFAEPAEDTVIVALFATSDIPPPPPREHSKRRRFARRMRLEHGRRSAMR